jgi:DNA polymerase-3 subunit chi
VSGAEQAEAGAALEVLFYQFAGASLEKVLPKLLEKTLERGWRAVVRVEGPERLEALDTALWTYSDESFLPHAPVNAGQPGRQPVLLSLDGANLNGAQVLFITDGGALGGFGEYARVAYLFDGADEARKARARDEWRAAKAAGAKVSYWRQTAEGRWEPGG